jgi:hypothetical protein
MYVWNDDYYCINATKNSTRLEYYILTGSKKANKPKEKKDCN